MTDNEIGIEAARARLGDLADKAHDDGTTTYLTRYGKRIAAITPTAEFDPHLHPTEGPLQPRLAYTTYLVLHRTLLQSMPVEWQQRMEQCLDELDDAFSHVDRAEHYEVNPCTEHLIEDMTPEQLAEAGITVDVDPNGMRRYHRQDDGAQLDGQDYATIGISEPLPHPNRGRTYIQPLDPDGEECGDELDGQVCILQAGFHSRGRHVDKDGNWWDQSRSRLSNRGANAAEQS